MKIISSEMASAVVLVLLLLLGTINLGMPSIKSSLGIDPNGARLLLFLFLSFFLMMVGQWKIRKIIFPLLLVLFLFLCLLILSIDKNEGIRLWTKLMVFPLVLFLGSKLNNSLIKKILFCLMCVYIIHWLYFPIFFMHGGWLSNEGLRFPGLTGTRTVFGTYSVLVFFASLLLVKKSKLRLYIIVLSLLGVLLSGSRLSFLELIAGVLFLGYIEELRVKKIHMLILLCLLAIFIVFFGSSVISRVGETHYSTEDGFSGSGGGTLAHRLMMWSLLIEYWLNHNIWFGSGLGSSTYVLGVNTDISKAMRVPHNEYVRLLVDTGIIGLTLYFSWFFARLRKAIKYKSIGGVFILVILIDCIGTNVFDFYFEVYGLAALLYSISLFRDGESLRFK